MDHPAELLGPARIRTVLDRLATIALRCGTAVARGAAAAAGWVWSDLLPWLFPLLARLVARVLRDRSVAALRRLAVAIAWRLAAVVVLAVAVLLVAAAPGYAARLAEADLWNLAAYVDGPLPATQSGTMALVVAAIVVLAAVSSHSDHHHHDHW